MTAPSDISAWFAGRLPDGWFTGPPSVEVDRDEILVSGELPDPEVDGSEGDRVAARRSRIQGFREDTRDHRVRIAREAEARFGSPVSWGARCGGEEALFTHVAAPAMTRLRMPERRVLDLLVEGGVARSRSDALAWCVRLVGANEEEWLGDLQEALGRVREVRGRAPS